MVLPVDVLDPAVPQKVVETVIHETWRAWKRCDYRLALALRRLLVMNAHRGSGVGDFGDWVEFRWEMPRKLAWTFAYLGKHLERLPELRRAMEEGRVGYTKAREFAAVAEPEDVEWWIDYASEHSYREVVRELERFQARKQGKKYVPKKVVTSELDPEQVQTARVLKEEITKKTGKPVSEGELFGMTLNLVRSGELGGELNGDTALGEAAKAAQQPHLSLQLCPSCLTSWVPVPGEDLESLVSKWLDALRGGAEVTEAIHDQLISRGGKLLRRDECPGWVPPPWTEEVKRHVSVEVRRHVEARDGHRCAVPGCSTSGPLEFSHLTAVKDGGPATRDNLRQHCYACNEMIETGALRVIGRAPFEKYYLKDGSFLGFGYDCAPFEQRFPHVGKTRDDGRVAEKPPPEWFGRRKTPA